MQIKKYGIVLKSITAADIELMRHWRNQDHVRLNMQYQKIISSEQQAKWFLDLDLKTNLYFVIKKENEKIGIVHLKEINWQSKQAEAGIFIGEVAHLNTISPLLATITIMEFAFDILKLEILKAKIASTNYKVILFNESIGYVKAGQQNEAFQYYETNQHLFLEATKNIRNTLLKLNVNQEFTISEEKK